MRYRGALILGWARCSCSLSRLSLSGGRITSVRTYSAHHPPDSPSPPNHAPPDGRSGAEAVKERAIAALKHAGELGQQWGQRSAQTAKSTITYWWARYEEFVGLNEVREAQTNVTQAESEFMVARGMVREAHSSLEALQVRLKEVRDRLDRVSREEAHYLELATLEHKLLQEERRLRTAYARAEGSERERFALFSAAVRESHEKERTRAERTKNWSFIGSVLGALIGVMGSTYINRVRLLELRNLLLEAQKGPESLQEALKVQAGIHRSQQDELRLLIQSLRETVTDAATQSSTTLTLQEAPAQLTQPPGVPSSILKDLSAISQRTETLLKSLSLPMGQLEEGLGRVESKLSVVRELLDIKPQVERAQRPEREERESPWGSELVTVGRRLEDSQRTMGERIRANTFYNAVFTYTATVISISAMFLMLRGAG